MYEEFYGFVQPPFSLTPDPRFLYRSESHDVALQQVWQAIRRKEGFIVLTGDIGTGKTTLCRTVLEQFDPTTFTALVLNPFLSVEELLRDVLVSYGVASRDALRTGRLSFASKHELVRTLHDFLLTLVPIHGSAVLIIDEAQHLSPEVLEEIRILSNLETNEQKLLQIVLVGQLNLLDVLHDAKLRQLDQRVSIKCLLKPLTREEVDAYVTHRLWVARGTSTVTFTPKAIDLIHALSGGVPRMINLLCDRALMAGAEKRTDKIGDDLITDAATALGLAPTVSRHTRAARVGTLRRVAIAATVLALAAVAGVMLYTGGVANPMTAFQGANLPAVATPPSGVALRNVTLPSPPDIPLRLIPPSASEGTFAVLIDTFASPRDSVAAEATLRARSLPLYAVDLRFSDGIRRRLFAGRFATREEAEKIRESLATTFPNARVVTAASELWQY
jgi:general secretion pathway protein A